MALVLSYVEIVNYKSIEDTFIDVNKIDESYTTILVGLNETGKSNFLNAIGLINPPTENVSYEKYKNSSNEGRTPIEAYYLYEYETKQEWQNILQEKVKMPKTLLDKIKINGLYLDISLQKGKTEFAKQLGVDDDISSIDNYEVYSYAQLPAPKTEESEKYEYIICKTAETNKYTADNTSESENSIEFKPLSKDALSEILNHIFKDEFSKCLLNCSEWKYKDEYLISNTIDLNEFKTNPNICYPLKNIFALAGFKTQEEIKNKIDEINGNDNAINRLQKRLQNALNGYVKKVWKECSVEFEIKIQDTLQLKVFVIDDADKDNTFNMDDRSDGAKQILSLILSISVANETEALKNNIIVIDEPEVHMHPSGIRYIREELLKIGQNNYVFIATHSQFMIDAKNKKRHYIVTKPNNNTEVNQWDETKDLSDDEILRQAFGINVLNDLLVPNKVLVEGYSDYQIIRKALFVLKLGSCIGITNGLGSKIISTATMLKLYNVPVLTIVDADKDGETYKKEIIKLGEPYNDSNVLTIRELVPDLIPKGTIEDTLDSQFIIKCFKNATKEITGFKDWEFEYNGEKAIVSEIIAYLRKTDKNFDISAITKLAKTKIGEEFNPTLVNLTNKHPKLKSLCEKILQYFGLEVE